MEIRNAKGHFHHFLQAMNCKKSNLCILHRLKWPFFIFAQKLMATYIQREHWGLIFQNLAKDYIQLVPCNQQGM